MSGTPTMDDRVDKLRARQARAREIAGEEGLSRYRESADCLCAGELRCW